MRSMLLRPADEAAGHEAQAGSSPQPEAGMAAGAEEHAAHLLLQQSGPAASAAPPTGGLVDLGRAVAGQTAPAAA